MILSKKLCITKLVTKLNRIDTSGFVSKTKYNRDISDIEKKISDAEKEISNTSGHPKKTDLNVKFTEIEGRILVFGVHISSWQSKGLSNEVIKPLTASNRLRPKLSYDDTRISVELDGN